MSSIVAAFTAPHVPLITAFPETPPEHQSRFVREGFARMRAELERRQVDTLIVVANDHLHQYFLNNMPAYVVVSGETVAGPMENWLRIPHYEMSVATDLADHILRYALAHGFDPVMARNVQLDHGHMIPLHFLNADYRFQVVPVIQNCVVSPMPSMERAYRFGEMLRQAVESDGKTRRVAVIGCGGISHFVGTKEMGWVDEKFDHEFLARFRGRNLPELFSLGEEELARAGNGAQEVRNWMVALGAAPAGEVEVYGYEPINAWITGMSFVQI
jgi:aromatic ring-opening dioxygenase catalytic subunit (LigB family)